jgi:hypothetical protein
MNRRWWYRVSPPGDEMANISVSQVPKQVSFGKIL